MVGTAAAFLMALLLLPGAAGAQLEQGPAVRAALLADGFAVPVFLTQPDDGSGRLFVVDQVGQVRIVDSGGDLLEEPFLDLSGRLVELDPDYDERGLLGLAFHPEYAENGRFFVYYSAPLREGAPGGWDHTSRLSELRVSADDPDRADPDSERIVMEIDQPFPNHNAGHIVFGHDGYLYVPQGDGGNGGDVDPPDDDRGRPPLGNAQTLETLLGSILRIDVDGEEPYAVPDDNPFVGEEGADETWAYGFRNPYGLSVDLETGDLYAADAGQALWEEASLVEAGRNYGWNIREGTHCFDPEDFVEPPQTCPDTGPRGEPLADPVVEYRRGPETGSVIVAGVRYRGSRLPELAGQFVFADYGRIRFVPSGVLYAAEPRDGLWEVRELPISNPIKGRADGELHRFVLAVSQDLDGELYVLTSQEGGPTGSTGEVFALEQPGAGDEEQAAASWWWVVLALVALPALALVVISLTRHRPGRAQARGDPS